MDENGNDSGFTFTWKIKNYSLCSQRGEEHLESPLFRVEMIENSEWKLMLFPRKNDEVVIRLYRVKMDVGPPTVAVNMKISILENGCASLFTAQNSFASFGRHTFVPFPISIKKVFNKKRGFYLEDTVVVQCHIWNKTTKNLVKCLAETQISVEKYHISLPVFCFSDNIFASTSEKLLKSVSKKYPDFKICWTNDHEKVNININIQETNFRIFVRCEISIQELNCSNNMLFEGDHWFETGRMNQVWTLSNIFQSVIPDMKLSDVKSYKIDLNLFASDATQNSFIESISDCSTIESKESIHFSSEYLLPKKLEKLYLEEKFSDFTIKTDKKVFRVHRNILGAISPVFCAMFEANMIEKEDSIVTIDDIDSEILEKMIHYFYTGKVVDIDWDDALKLYAAADKYQVMEVRVVYARILISKMDPKTIDVALNLADLHQDKMILNAAKKMIRENVAEVIRSEMWSNFMGNNPKIACEVMHEILINSSQVF